MVALSMINTFMHNNATKNTAFGDVFCWHLVTVWINIDRERASPSKRHSQCNKD